VYRAPELGQNGSYLGRLIRRRATEASSTSQGRNMISSRNFEGRDIAEGGVNNTGKSTRGSIFVFKLC